MAAPLSKNWRKFPPLATQIDWSNPLTRNLGRVITPSSGLIDVVTRKISTVQGTVTRNPAGFKAASENGNRIELLDFPASQYTCLAIANASTASRPEILIGRINAGPLSSQNYLLYLNNGVTAVIQHRQTADNIYKSTSSSFNVQAGSTAVLVGTYDGTNQKIFVNGRLGNSSAATDPYVSISGVATQLLSADAATATYGYEGSGILLAAIWNRALTDAEVAEVSENPWQLFRPQSQQLAVFSPVYQPGSDITVTGWTGSPDNVNLYANIDESTPSDTDYVLSPSLSGTPGPAIFGLSPSSLAAGNYTVNLRARRTGVGGQVRALLVNSSGTTVGTSSWQSLTTTYTTYNLAITTTGTAARLRFEVQE